MGGGPCKIIIDTMSMAASSAIRVGLVVAGNNASWSAREQALLGDLTTITNKSLCLGPTTAVTAEKVTQVMANNIEAATKPLTDLLAGPIDVSQGFQPGWYIHHADAIHAAVVAFAAAVDEVLEDLGYAV